MCWLSVWGDEGWRFFGSFDSRDLAMARVRELGGSFWSFRLNRNPRLGEFRIFYA